MVQITNEDNKKHGILIYMIYTLEIQKEIRHDSLQISWKNHASFKTLRKLHVSFIAQETYMGSEIYTYLYDGETNNFPVSKHEKKTFPQT